MSGPAGVLRLGNLEDIIYLRKMEIMLLQERFNLLEDELTDSETCELRDCKNGCKYCSLKELCQKEIDEFYEEAAIIQEKQEKIRREIGALEDEIIFLFRERRRLGLPNY